MKSAEDVAEEISSGIPFDRALDHHYGTLTHDYCPECHVCKDCTEKAIAQALAAFAEERVKYAWGKDDLDHFERVQKVARAEALEEAAKVAEKGPGPGDPRPQGETAVDI